MKMRGVLSLFGALVLLFAAAACGDEAASEPAAKPEILAFTTSVARIRAGGSATLSWQTRNATKVEIRDETGSAIDIGDAKPANGSVAVAPVARTTYALTARGPGGTATSTVLVEVDVSALPPTVDAFSVTPAEARLGEPITLAWTLSNATSYVIRDAAGAPVDARGAASGSGQVTIPARASTTYEILAKGPGGEARARAPVTVSGAPTAVLAGPVAPVAPGQTTPLTWTTTRAAQVRITSGTTVLYEGSDRLSGSIDVAPLQTTTYEIVATGKGGEAQASAQIAVQPLVESFVAEIPAGDVRAGDEILLRWRVAGARAITVRHLGGVTYEASAAELEAGSVRLRVGLDGAFVLQARSGTLLTEAIASVPIADAPRLRTVAANPTAVTADANLAADVTLSWFADGASVLEVEAIPGGDVSTVGRSPRSDTMSVTVHENTTFRVTARNEFGAQTVETSVEAHLPPAVDRFVARPSLAGVGETVRLVWESTEAATVRLEKDGVALAVAPATVDGTFDDVVLVESTYVLRTFNDLGYEVASEPVVVRVGPPENLAFTATPSFVPTGHPLVFAWANDGGIELHVTDPAGVVVCSTTDLDEIASGSCQIPGPPSGTHEYTLHVVNGVGDEVTATASVEATDGPVVLGFTAADTLITFDEPVALAWNVSSDAAGVTPSVAVTDGQGRTYPLGGADPQNGTATITLPAPGTYVLTLTATTPGTTSDTATVTIDARGIPSIATLAAAPETVDTRGGTVPNTTQIAWTTTNAASLELFRLDAGGQPVRPAVFATAAAADVRAGNTALVPPPGVVTYLLEVDNGAGRKAQGAVSVTADPAAIDSFAVTPAEILAGETVVLSWATHNASTVSIAPMALSSAAPPAVTPLDNAYVDISTLAGATRLTIPTDDDDYSTIAFPAGFTFPFDGVERTSVRASTNGFLTFSTTTAGNFSNRQFPNSETDQRNVHIAVFWDDLHRTDGGNNGQIWALAGSDALGRWVIVEWKNFALISSDTPSSLFSNLNFQVVLREDGSLEYRYGTMSANTTSEQSRANGNSATIGYQNVAFNVGHNIHFGGSSSAGTELPGGLTNRGWRVVFPQAASGALTLTPTVDTTWRLFAGNGYSSAQASATATVRPAVAINSATLTPAEPAIGAPMTISWTTTNATAVEVRDASNTVRCTAAAGQLNSGSCTVQEASSGTYTYTVRATGVLARDVQTRTLTTTVLPAFTLDSFTASAPSIVLGESVTLSWATTGAVSATLTADGTPISLAGRNLASGSITLTPTRSTTYVFTISDGLTPTPRTRTAQQAVSVRTTTVATTGATQTAAGGPTTITWTTTGNGTVTIPGVARITEITEPFIDVSTTGTRITLSDLDDGSTTITFPAGFTFPFDGIERTQVRLVANGFLDFTGGSSIQWTNTSLPTTSESVTLAPFWDDLDGVPFSGATPGELWWGSGTDTTGPYLAIQWKRCQVNESSSSSTANLNFEVLLRPTGVFEYRYGTMTSSGTTTSTNQARADGSSATIGFQETSGTIATTLSFNTAMTGGLSNRSFRFDVHPANGSITVTPNANQTYRVCSSKDGYTECKEVVVPMVSAGDVLISEIMAAPAGGLTDPQGEWFEVRNTTHFPIDINGWVIGSAGGDTPATITNGGPLVVPPGGVMTLAASGPSGNGGFTPGYVYGAGPTFNHAAADDVTLTYGTLVVDRVGWDGTWTLAPGTSIFLDPSNHVRDATRNDTRARWCTSSAAYDGGTNRGSPGTVSGGCVSTSYDLDPFSTMPFIDIAATGTDLPSVNTDTATTTVTGGIGFTMPFFTGTATDLSVSSNGLLVLNATGSSTSANTSTVPSTSTPNAYVAPFWDDLVNQPGSSVRTEIRTVGGRQVRIVQWTNFKRFGRIGSITFQAQLWDNGDIVTAYKDLAGVGVDRTYYEGVDATFAIEDATGGAGLLFSANKRAIFSGRSLLYRKK